MSRQCWAYSQGLPMIEVIFQALDGTHVTRTLEVDCGASGGMSCFVLSEDD
jgi:hypothetical protein